jgi:RNA polymerase sigma-70 factor (sigma-E family)
MSMAMGGFARDARAVADAQPGAATSGAVAPGMTGQAADEAVTVAYQAHYAVLVRISTMLVGDVATAEDVVQESFIAMHRAWWRLRDTSRALPYLRHAVINKSRSVLRHRAVADRHLPAPAPELPSAEESALAGVQRSSVLEALSALPCRQREVVILRYYSDLSEAEIAAALGISRGAVKSHAARAKGSLRGRARVLTPRAVRPLITTARAGRARGSAARPWRRLKPSRHAPGCAASGALDAPPGRDLDPRAAGYPPGQVGRREHGAHADQEAEVHAERVAVHHDHVAAAADD